MSKGREYMPGDEVELYFSYPESDGDKHAHIVSMPHNDRIQVRFNNGNQKEISVSDIAKRLYK